MLPGVSLAVRCMALFGCHGDGSISDPQEVTPTCVCLYHLLHELQVL